MTVSKHQGNGMNVLNGENGTVYMLQFQDGTSIVSDNASELVEEARRFSSVPAFIEKNVTNVTFVDHELVHNYLESLNRNAHNMQYAVTYLNGHSSTTAKQLLELIEFMDDSSRLGECGAWYLGNNQGRFWFASRDDATLFKLRFS